MATYSAARWIIGFAALIAYKGSGIAADNAGNLITNGGFEAGMQIWKGDGKIVLLPDGNRVCEIDASKSKMKDLKQEFRMKQLQQVEVIFRARSLNYTGPGLRISIHQIGGGSMIWNRELRGDGSWGQVRIVYTRAGGNVDLRELNIATLIGTGQVQIDDVEVREPSKVVDNPPPQPATPVTPPPIATPTPPVKPSVTVVKPSTPVVVSPPAAPVLPPPTVPPGAIGSLEQILNGIPAEALQKLKDSATTEAGIAEINDYFTKNVKHKTGWFRIKVDFEEPITAQKNKFRIRAKDRPVSGPGGSELNGRIWAYFPGDNVPAEGKAPVGSDVTVSGEIGRCDVNNKGKLQINIDLEQSKLEGP